MSKKAERCGPRLSALRKPIGPVHGEKQRFFAEILGFFVRRSMDGGPKMTCKLRLINYIQTITPQIELTNAFSTAYRVPSEIAVHPVFSFNNIPASHVGINLNCSFLSSLDTRIRACGRAIGLPIGSCRRADMTGMRRTDRSSNIASLPSKPHRSPRRWLMSRKIIEIQRLQNVGVKLSRRAWARKFCCPGVMHPFHRYPRAEFATDTWAPMR